MSPELERSGDLSIEATFALRSFASLGNCEFHFYVFVTQWERERVLCKVRSCTGGHLPDLPYSKLGPEGPHM